MTDLETGESVSPLAAGLELATASTPLGRAAGRLQAVLPPGWRVEIVGAPDPARQPVLRVVMPEG